MPPGWRIRTVDSFAGPVKFKIDENPTKTWQV